jgi:small subunit ribosomal protein S17
MRKKMIGSVASDKRDKTLRVEIELRKPHPKYGKIIHGRTVCQVHDEEGQARVGDKVEIVECPPRSRSKRWELVRVISSSALVEATEHAEDIAAAAAESE